MKLFIFGSTGDLVKRKILPALQSIQKKDLQVYALGRQDFLDECYEDFACKKCSEDFRKRLEYIRVDFEKDDICMQCEHRFDSKEEVFFYISLPPKLYRMILKEIARMKKKGAKIKVLFEKPFGTSLNDAKKLFEEITEYGMENDVFISDHYLFKKNVLSLKKRRAKKVRIVSLEEVGLEGRTYYDNVGTLKDMVQNHLLNIAFRILGREEFDNFQVLEYVRGQYKGYQKEIGKKSETQTYVRVKLKTKNSLVELITGKKFGKKSKFIEIDKEKITLNSHGDVPYAKVFRDFFEKKSKNFPSFENSVRRWEITEKIALSKDVKIIEYEEGINPKNYP